MHTVNENDEALKAYLADKARDELIEKLEKALEVLIPAVSKIAEIVDEHEGVLKALALAAQLNSSLRNYESETRDSQFLALSIRLEALES
jgi:hypothetical protein